MSDELKAQLIKTKRDSSGPLHAQLRGLVDRSHEISEVFPTVEPAKKNVETYNPVFSLPETNFPAVDLGSHGKCARAWRAVQEAYAAH